MWQALEQRIGEATGERLGSCDRTPVGGGCINRAYRLSDGTRQYFVKLNSAVQVAMFEAEALGLQDLYDTHTIKVPQPISWGVIEDSAYLVLEWLEFGSGDPSAWYRMGEHLAALHHSSSPKGFGWRRQNTIGDTPQPNSWDPDWLSFYREQRLSHQFRLSRRRGGHFPRAQALLDALPQLLYGHEPAPALVHGDLWSGNAAVTTTGEPVVLDPATYYGDREVDIAMTELFGRFPARFYEGYTAAYPLEPGYERRKILYNLYHVVNHFNLFGGSYESQANRMIDQLLR